jgi:hypothetical protein
MPKTRKVKCCWNCEHVHSDEYDGTLYCYCAIEGCPSFEIVSPDEICGNHKEYEK